MINRPKETKINQLLKIWPQGTVATSVWLAENGITKKDKKAYEKRHWLQSIGVGAVIRSGDSVNWEGGVYALQKQLHLPIHVGAKTALELQGQSHYVRMGRDQVILLGKHGAKPPKWFCDHNWGADISYYTSTILPPNLGLHEHQDGSIPLLCSSRERAIIECLHMVPSRQSFEEAYHLVEGLMGLRPSLMQQLLENCNSIKAKRLLLYFAQRANLPWVKRLDLAKVNLGSGKRQIVANGILEPKYQITIPRSFEENEE